MKVLVAPLDWGLGHAARCVPIIRFLVHKGCSVIVASSGDALQLLKQEFPALEAHELPAYAPWYSHSNAMVGAMARQLPHFIKTISQEQRVIEALVQDCSVDVVISDNRYGCWSKAVPSYLITHQTNILMPKHFRVLEPVVAVANSRMMKKFTAVWIPDSQDRNLSGTLAAVKRSSGVNLQFIGPLSRFYPSSRQETLWDVVAVFSGPEPQRSIFEKLVRPQLESSGLRYRIVRGVVTSEQRENDYVFNHLASCELQMLLEASKVVIARSGYSTIMDLAALGKKAILVPTPGQTEQEYLAATLDEKQIALRVLQPNVNLARAVKDLESYSGFKSGNYAFDTYKSVISSALGI